MKNKLLFGTIALFLLASCSDSDKSKINPDARPQENEMQNSEMAVREATPEETTAAVNSINSVSQETAIQKNPVTILTFCHWDGSDKSMIFLDGSKVFGKLKQLGFIKKSEKVVWQGEDEAAGEYITTKKRVYVLDENSKNFSIELEYNDFGSTKWLMEAKISFPTSEEAEAFVSTAVENHYKKISPKLYRGHPSDVYWAGTEIKVNGNVVDIEIIGEA